MSGVSGDPLPAAAEHAEQVSSTGRETAIKQGMSIINQFWAIR